MIYVIGDIHGQFDMLLELYEHIKSDLAQKEGPHKIVFLGDYIDRGPDSQGVLDFLMTRENTPDVEHVFILGNHEQMFFDAMMYPYLHNERQMWVENGGQAWLDQANMRFSTFHAHYPWARYTNWMESRLDLYHETEHYIFVHGGIDVRKSMSDQSKDHMIWARHMQPNWYKDYGKIIVHGHTPNKDPIVEPGRIDVDTSYRTDGLIQLTCAMLPNDGAPLDAEGAPIVDFLAVQRRKKKLKP